MDGSCLLPLRESSPPASLPSCLPAPACLQDQEASTLQLQDSQQEAAGLREEAEAQAVALRELAAHVRRRRAAARWRYAAAAVLVPAAVRGEVLRR